MYVGWAGPRGLRNEAQRDHPSAETIKSIVCPSLN